MFMNNAKDAGQESRCRGERGTCNPNRALEYGIGTAEWIIILFSFSYFENITLNRFVAHLQFLPRISSRLYSVSSRKLSDAKI